MNFRFDHSAFAENIKQARRGRGLSQKSVAKILSVSKATISLWENDKAQPTIDNMLALCWLYEFSPVSFLIVKTEEAVKTQRMFAERVGEKPIAAHGDVFDHSPFFAVSGGN